MENKQATSWAGPLLITGVLFKQIDNALSLEKKLL